MRGFYTKYTVFVERQVVYKSEGKLTHLNNVIDGSIHDVKL